jgi:hypothetical protein
MKARLAGLMQMKNPLLLCAVGGGGGGSAAPGPYVSVRGFTRLIPV